MRIKLEVSKAERTMILAALVAYGLPDLARKISEAQVILDPAADGPEVEIIARVSQQ